MRARNGFVLELGLEFKAADVLYFYVRHHQPPG
jgi:hypothetical protein